MDSENTDNNSAPKGEEVGKDASKAVKNFPSFRHENGVQSLDAFGVSFMEKISLPPQDDEKADTNTLVLAPEMVLSEDTLDTLVLSEAARKDATEAEDVLQLEPSMKLSDVEEVERLEDMSQSAGFDENDVLILSNSTESKASVHYSARVDFPITEELIDMLASRVWLRIKEKLSEV